MTARPGGMPLRVGIVGHGAIGQLQRRVVDTTDGATVTAVVTRRDPAVVPGVRTYRHLRDLLDDPDVDLVAICTPSGLHAEQALEAVRAGKHVVVEKPFALDPAVGAAVVAEARGRGSLLSVISQRRFAPDVVAVKRGLDDGTLGRPLLGEALQRWHRDQAYYDSAAWRGTTALDGGVLMNQAIHAVDMLCWFFGPVDEVSGSCATFTHRMESEDTAVATLRFASGALGVISATTCLSSGLPAELNVVASRGIATVHGTRIVRWAAPGARPAGTGGDERGGADRPMDMKDTEHRRQWLDIVDAVTEGRDPLVTGEDGLASASVVAAIYRSWREARPIRPEHQDGHDQRAWRRTTASTRGT